MLSLPKSGRPPLAAGTWSTYSALTVTIMDVMQSQTDQSEVSNNALMLGWYQRWFTGALGTLVYSQTQANILKAGACILALCNRCPAEVREGNRKAGSRKHNFAKNWLISCPLQILFDMLKSATERKRRRRLYEISPVSNGNALNFLQNVRLLKLSWGVVRMQKTYQAAKAWRM